MSAQLQFTISNQTIKRTDDFQPVSESLNYLYAGFTFATADWDEVNSKTAVFTNGELSYEVLLDSDNECLVPWETIANSGDLYVSVYGGSRVTVNKARVYIGQTGYVDDANNGGTPTPTVYEQLLSAIDDLEDSIPTELPNPNALTIATESGNIEYDGSQTASVDLTQLTNAVSSVNGYTGNVVLKTSDLTNDSGYITEHQSLANYVTETELNTGLSAKQNTLTAGDNITITNNVISAVGGSSAVTSVNGQTGAVVLDASDVNALPSSTVIPTVPTNVSAFNNDAGYLTSHQSLSGYATETWVTNQGYAEASTLATVATTGSYNDLSDTPTIPTIPVSSVNGQTGAVVLDADDVGALADNTTYVSSFNGSSGAITYTAPVTSVNGSTGAVSLTASDVGALADDTTYVSSVNGSSGAVTIANATTSTAGLMSATDKANLDAVYADYSSAILALGV